MVQQVSGYVNQHSSQVLKLASQNGAIGSSGDLFKMSLGNTGATQSSEAARSPMAGSDASSPFQQMSDSVQSFLLQLQSSLTGGADSADQQQAATDPSSLDQTALDDDASVSDAKPGHRGHHHAVDQDVSATAQSAAGTVAANPAAVNPMSIAAQLESSAINPVGDTGSAKG